MNDPQTPLWPLNALMRARLITALSGTPAVVAALTSSLAPTDALWDRRPHPGRFTLREIVAHLADWDRIYLERLTLMRDRPGAPLPDYDEDRLAAIHDYSHADPAGSLIRFSKSRRAVAGLLSLLRDEQWEHTGRHESYGEIAISLLASFVLMHDGYHTEQIAQWLRLPE